MLDRVLLLGYKPLHVAALAKKLLDAVRPADGDPEYRTHININISSRNTK